MNKKIHCIRTVQTSRSRPQNHRHPLVYSLWLVGWLVVWWLTGQFASAQPVASRIIISSVSAESAPTIELGLLAIDGAGNPIDLNSQTLTILHNGQPIPPENIQLAGTKDEGTFTLLVLDVPPGVQGELPAIQAAVESLAAEPNMREGVDYVAAYRVDEVAASPLLEPANFHNTVRNLFASPLAPTQGATALLDSLIGLLNNMESLKPNPGMAAAIVLMSDGTDTVSTQAQPADVPIRAAELGIPIHTIWLNNTNLQNPGVGQTYMTQLAQGTGGVSATIDNTEAIQTIWTNIAAFRVHTLVQYTVPGAVGGTFPVVVGLQGSPGVQAATSVTIPAAAPSVVIDVPPESRTLTLIDLNNPVELSFSTNVSWIDGVERSITSARLLVNGIEVQTIDPTQLDRFTAAITNFTFGTNRVQISVTDSEGNRATSPELVLTINQGAEEVIPPVVQPPSGTSQLWERLAGSQVYILTCVGIIVLFFVFTILALVLRKFPILRLLRLDATLRRIPWLRPYIADMQYAQSAGRQAQHYGGKLQRYAPDKRGRTGKDEAAARPQPFLEVLESVSRVNKRIDLDKPEMKLGRSPKQSDFAFEDDVTVSRLHCSIVQEGGDYRVYDDQSTSGTFVNEQRVPEYGLQLVDGDEIRLGAIKLRFRQP